MHVMRENNFHNLKVLNIYDYYGSHNNFASMMIPLEKNIIKNHLKFPCAKLSFHTTTLLRVVYVPEETNELWAWNNINCMLFWLTIMWIWQVVNLTLWRVRSEGRKFMQIFYKINSCGCLTSFRDLDMKSSLWTKFWWKFFVDWIVYWNSFIWDRTEMFNW